MPRQYLCKTCGNVHAPPTGKKCRWQETEHEEDDNESEDMAEMEAEGGETDPMMHLMLQMKQQMDGMEQNMRQQMDGIEERMRKVETGGDSESVRARPVRDADNENEVDGEHSAALDVITPATLRNDVRAMQRAAQRIAQIGTDDLDDDDLGYGGRRNNGKKSGSLLTKADNIKTRIDWPHMYVNRVNGGATVAVGYKELKVEEFVLGYLMMLDARKDKWDKEVMLEILKMLMQDTVDFAWENALNFYKMIGLDVEAGVRRWDDTEAISRLRLVHSRTVYPEKKDNKEAKKPTGQKTTPQNLRCCALYQRRACEHNRDHMPFSHACSYCAKSTGMAYRHPEEDCFRKTLDDSKNSKKRE